jgi:hypothetical protein
VGVSGAPFGHGQALYYERADGIIPNEISQLLQFINYIIINKKEGTFFLDFFLKLYLGHQIWIKRGKYLVRLLYFR